MSVWPAPAPASPWSSEVRGGLPPYAAALGLIRVPFPVTPDETRYFFSPQAEAIFAELRHFIEMRKGFMLLTGEVGLGKTTLIRRLLASFDPERFNTALILTSFLDSNELLETIARDFGLVLPPDARRIDHLQSLNQFLLSQSEAGKTNVLFIDDAQTLNAEALDVVRQLSNLETAQAKLIQVVLTGQTELEEALGDRSLRQLRSRIALHRQLRPLAQDECRAYIEHRLAGASEDGRSRIRLEPDALHAVHHFTAGVPRNIHHLMDRCLYGLVVSDSNCITQAMVQQAWRDLHEQGLVDLHPSSDRRPAGSWGLPAGMAWLSDARIGWALAGISALLVGVAWSAWARLPGADRAQGAGARPVAAEPLAQPEHWATLSARYPALARLRWPRVASPHELAHDLNWQLNQGDEQERVLVSVLPGTRIKACAGQPLLNLKTSTGEAWQMVFLDPQWPRAPLAQSQDHPVLMQVQDYLVGQGLLVTKWADGLMGPHTMAALATLQSEEGLERTGQFDPSTTYRLICRLQAQQAAPAAAPTGVPAGKTSLGGASVKEGRHG